MKDSPCLLAFHPVSAVNATSMWTFNRTGTAQVPANEMNHTHSVVIQKNSASHHVHSGLVKKRYCAHKHASSAFYLLSKLALRLALRRLRHIPHQEAASLPDTLTP